MGAKPAELCLVQNSLSYRSIDTGVARGSGTARPLLGPPGETTHDLRL